MIKSFVVTLPEDVHYTLKHKCRFYNITMQEVTGTLLAKFIEGEYDELFNLPNIKPEDLKT